MASTLDKPPRKDMTARAGAEGSVSGGSRRTWRDRLSWLDFKASPYLYISPFFLLFALTGLFPLIYTVFVAMHDWDLLSGQGKFVGFANFTTTLGDRFFWNSIENTVSIFLWGTIPQILGALLLAAVLDQHLKAVTFWRMGVLLPYVVTPVAVALIFSSIFRNSADTSLANNLLSAVGLDPIEWKRDRLASHVAIGSMVNWRWTGYNALILLAAMQAIPGDLYEAAVIDGASRARQFFSVTIPMLRPTIIFVVITSTIGGLQIFDEPRMYDQFGQGGADRQWMTVTMYLYELGWGAQQSFGRAAAVAWILFLIIIAIGLLNFFLTQRISSSGSRAGKDKR
ncbi:MAG: sugar ABC transporter permease [Actinobacteria bacterium]|nr:sugar ABC transporter permease [Actinomycetota bacterium]